MTRVNPPVPQTGRTRAPGTRRLPWLLAMLLGLAVGPTLAQDQDVLLDRILAVVNEGVVLASDLDTETEFVKRQAGDSQQALPPDDVLRERILERLIDQEIRQQRARTIGVAVDAASINRRIEQIAGSNNLDTVQLRQTLQAQGFNYDHFRRNVEQDLLLDRLIQRDVQPRIRVSGQEIDDFVDAQLNRTDKQQRYRLQHILIALASSAPANDVASAEARATAVLARLRNGEEFAPVAAAESDGARALQGGDLGWRDLQELPDFLADAVRDLPIGDIAGPLRSPNGLHIVKLADRGNAGQGEQEETLARHIFIGGDNDGQTLRTLEDIRARLLAGESFAALAEAYSEDPNSAAAGGELPWFAKGQMPGELEQAAASLAPGAISQPFRTQFGWHVLEVLDRRTREITRTALRQRAEQSLRQRKVEQEAERWIRQLRDESFIDIRS